MKYAFFDSDMAVDYLSEGNGKEIAVVKNLSYGIRECTVNVKNRELEERIGKKAGLYLTYDCASVDNDKGREFISRKIANAISNMLGILPRGATILVVGLGNSAVTADALGVETLKSVVSTRLSPSVYGTKSVKICTLGTGVATKTGIESEETVRAVVDKIKPHGVIVVDALATSSVQRLGTSYQLTTAGIAPGSGVYASRPAIDKSTLGVPVVAIGVPLVLGMRTLIYDFTRKYLGETGERVDEYLLRKTVEEKRLARLVVAPKDITLLVENASKVIATGINLAFKMK